jgi:hypothetical protein
MNFGTGIIFLRLRKLLAMEFWRVPVWWFLRFLVDKIWESDRSEAVCEDIVDSILGK